LTSKAQKLSSKYEGAVGWTEFEGIKSIARAILRPNELALEFSYDLSSYTGVLKFDGDRFAGDLDRVWDRKDHSKVKATCRLFKRDEELLFFGTWTEDGTSYRFWINLDPSED
jgi:hypothetical protein